MPEGQKEHRQAEYRNAATNAHSTKNIKIFISLLITHLLADVEITTLHVQRTQV